MRGDGTFLGANRALCTLIGGDCHNHIGHNCYHRLLTSVDPERWQRTDLDLLASGGTENMRAELLLAGGGVRPVTLKKAAQGGADGYIVVTVVDQLDLSEMENALEISEAEKRAILKGFPGIVCLFDTRERVVWANAKVYELHLDPVGRTCHEIFCQREKACNSCAVPKSLESGTIQSSIQQFEISTASGEELVYELTSTPVRDATGEITSVVVIGRDVTETSILEKQLRHTQKMEAIGTLAGGIAHDFNNVLTPIMGYAEILKFQMQKNGTPDGGSLEFLEGILKAGKRAKRLVEQILTFSRSTEQRASLQYIHPIVKEVMKLMRVTLPTTITIKEDIDEQCGAVLVDPVQVHQILLNLCTNSAHAMAGGHGTLTVSLGSSGMDQNGLEWLQLSISDTGCGIAPDMLDRIFEPYFTTKEKERGTGMGLAMVHGIVTRQRGRIEVESTVGEGTTFTIFLPVAGAATRLDQVVSSSELPLGRGHILLVDDEAQVVQVTGELLTSLGYTVTGRTSPLAALEVVVAEPHNVDLLLTDLTMPELTGIELARRVRELVPKLPVVLFTGYSDSVPKDEVVAAGIEQYVMKPVSFKELAQVIAATLAHSQQ